MLTGHVDRSQASGAKHLWLARPHVDIKVHLPTDSRHKTEQHLHVLQLTLAFVM